MPRPELCEPLARALQSLGVRRGMVVCGLAEGKSSGRTFDARRKPRRGILPGARLGGFQLCRRKIFHCKPAALADLRGGDKSVNAEIIRRILRGDERGPKRDAVLLNAAAALFVAGKAKSLAEGWDLAAETIDSGKAAAKLGGARGLIQRGVSLAASAASASLISMSA